MEISDKNFWVTSDPLPGTYSVFGNEVDTVKLLCTVVRAVWLGKEKLNLLNDTQQLCQEESKFHIFKGAYNNKLVYANQKELKKHMVPQKRGARQHIQLNIHSVHMRMATGQMLSGTSLAIVKVH